MVETVNTLSRRSFAQLLGAGVASAVLSPAAAAAAVNPALRQDKEQPLPDRVIRLSSNENPRGPSPAALDAMRAAFGLAWRYPDEHGEALAKDIAGLHGVDPKQVVLGDGSSEILKLCAAAYTGPDRGLVIAEPTFEALAHYAGASRAETRRVPLTSDYRHDLPGMLAAGPQAGLFYLCNPNNPTATVTPAAEVKAFLAKLPAGAMALVDEAYHHFAEGGGYESVIPLVATTPGLVVARTFSKIYGMAGLRCGYAVASPEAAERLRAEQSWDSLNIMAIAAARASLKDTAHVERGRRENSEVKAELCARLDSMGYRTIPSFANFLMIDLRRPVKPVIEALRQRRVEVGRVFPAMPRFLRVTLGTGDQMHGFLAAFAQVMAAPV